LSEWQFVAGDIAAKASQGIRSILHLGFVATADDAGQLIATWGQRLQDAGVEKFIYAVIGRDDSNCDYRPFSSWDENYRLMLTETIKSAFPGVALRGHVQAIAGWPSRACRPLDPTIFTLRDETMILAYDFRGDGVPGPSAFSRDTCGLERGPTTASLIL